MSEIRDAQKILKVASIKWAYIIIVKNVCSAEFSYYKQIKSLHACKQRICCFGLRKTFKCEMKYVAQAF